MTRERLRNNNNRETDGAGGGDSNPHDLQQEEQFDLSRLTPAKIYERLAMVHSLSLPQDQRGNYVTTVMGEFNQASPDQQLTKISEIQHLITESQARATISTPAEPALEAPTASPIEPISIPKDIFDEPDKHSEHKAAVINKKQSIAKRAFYRAARPVYLAYIGIKKAFNKTRKFLHLQPLVQGHH